MSLLRKEAAHYNDASLSTFMKLKVYRVHVIKSQVTLSEISLDDETHWKCIELRSAKLPTAWSDKVSLVQYMELLATLLYVYRKCKLECFVWNSPIFIVFQIACHENQRIQKQLVKENIGLISFSGPSIGSVIRDN